MLLQIPSSLSSFQNILGQCLASSLKNYVLRVKKLKRWYLVDPLTKAFIKGFMIMKLRNIKSILLIKTLIRVIKMLRELSSKDFEYLKEGVKEAWRLSMIASSWAHPTATSWKNNKAYIAYLGLTLKWIHRLLGVGYSK